MTKRGVIITSPFRPEMAHNGWLYFLDHTASAMDPFRDPDP